MKLIIEGRAEEIAALAAELQGRQGGKPTAETIRDIFLEELKSSSTRQKTALCSDSQQQPRPCNPENLGR